MIRLRALNQELSEESEGEEDIPSITRDAQEQIAFAQYNEALGMLREKNIEGARTQFQDLLENSFLVEIKKQEGVEGLNHPALVLKYSCLKNMGAILEKLDELQGALQHFLKAAAFDGTDVSLWYRIGLIATRVVDYELACDAYLEGLKCSPKHWPCLDNLVTILYVLNDYIPCLLYISRAFELDPDFYKGSVFRDKILLEQPSIIDEFNLYCKGCELGTAGAEHDSEIGREMVEEALELREKKRKLCVTLFAPKPLEQIALIRPLSTKTWSALGESLVQLHRHIQTSGKIRQFCCPVDLETTTGMSNEEINVEKVKEDEMDVDQMENEEAKPPNEDGVAAPAGEEEAATDATGTPEGEESKSRKRRRSSLSFLEQWMWGGKRRSARVRSTLKRETEREDCNLEEVLRRLVPPSLLPTLLKDDKKKDQDGLKSSEDSLDTMDLYKMFERRESTEGRSNDNQSSAAVSPTREKEELSRILSEEGYFGSEKETADVEEFIKLNTRHDIIDILYCYMKILSSKWQLRWPSTQPSIFLQAYRCMRQHINHPSAFSTEEAAEDVKEDACITLLYAEMFLDWWLQNKENNGDVIDYADQIPAESIGQLVFVSVRGDLFHEDHLNFMLRLYWLKAHLFLNQGSTRIAIESLRTILHRIEEMCDEQTAVKVILPNNKHHHIINKEITQKLLTTLSRNQSLFEVQNLYDEHHYEELIEILQETFHYSKKSKLPRSVESTDSSGCPDRATQLGMLMDALWQLKRYQDCFYWGEACCHEALHKYLNSEEKEQNNWASTIEKLLSALETCVSKAGLSVIDKMPNSRLTRLVQNLTHIVCHQQDAPDTAVEMPIESISPWILLQKILQQTEEKRYEEDGVNLLPVFKELPGYISILFTAHEFLGRRSWCCSNEGALLLYIMDTCISKLKDERIRPVKDKLIQGLEQVFYCLYASPNKKTKTRYLQDHGVPQIPLTWERGMQLFQFYLPEDLPEFDSYRVISITADVECLLKRIAALIPSHCNPAHLVEKVVSYIDGNSPSLPVLGDARTQLPRSVSAIYYLLADYYFKANEWSKAIRHYLLDVCVNPVRIDSWAGMALARGSMLETKLNSCEPLKSEMEFLRQASAAQRCFQRSVDIEANHSLMWIEYGSFVYMVHSFCSRLLKQETDSLSLEMFEILENQKEEKLKIAVKCFTSASRIWYSIGEDNGIQDERWLHQYMLGKIVEKRDQDPSVYLGHFISASKHLHENRASYARKVNYNNPQNLAVEALEVYYRIHACILKYLEQNEGKKLERDKKNLFEKVLKETSEGPFMASSSKDAEGKTESDEERKKRQFPEAGDVLDDVVYFKKARLDLPLDICMMEDVIDVMEGLISKVVDIENKRIESEGKTKPVVTKTEATDASSPNICKVSNVSGEGKEPLPNQSNTKAELTEEYDDLRDAGNQLDKLDCLDLAMEVVEEVVEDEEMIEIDMNEKMADESEKTDNGIIKTEIGDEKANKLDTTGKEGSADKVEGEEELDDDKRKMKEPDKAELAESKKMAAARVTKRRRSSQESMSSHSTTSTDTSSPNSSSSSSDSESSSSNDDSSSSSSSSDSDNSSDSSEDEEQVKKQKKEKSAKGNGTKLKKETEEEDSEDGNHDHFGLVRRCLMALEECVLRFPHHYKSLYRLSHYYFHSKFHRNVAKCQELLMGTYKCLPMEGRSSKASFQGLFAERKNNNFFNGVWRIPVSEIDRPGSFASHMSRCVLLLMEVLREVKDHRMLLELCLQLKRTPEADKKYLRDSERDQLCRQALTLALQAIRVKLRETPVTSNLLVEVYRAYQRAQRYLPHKEGTFAALLKEAYKQHTKAEAADLDSVIRFCQQLIVAGRTPAVPAVTTTSAPTPVTSTQPVTTSPPAVTTTSTTSVIAQPPQPRKVTTTPVVKPPPSTTAIATTTTTTSTVTAAIVPPIVVNLPTRTRGRPPNVSRNLTSASSKTQSVSNRAPAPMPVPSAQLGPVIPPSLTSPGMSPFYPFPNLFSDPSLLTAAVQSKLPATLDQALNLLNLQAQIGGYQAEFLRHFATATSAASSSLISSMTASQNQKSPVSSRSCMQPPQITTTCLPSSISITPIPSSHTTVPCSSNTSTSASTKYNINKNSKTSKQEPSLQQKLQASQALAKSSSARSSLTTSAPSTKSNTITISPPFSKSSSQKSPSSSLPPTTHSYTPPKEQMMTKSPTNIGAYASFLKGAEGMLPSGVSITQVAPMPANTSTSTKSTTSKLMSFRKHSISSLQGNQNQDLTKLVSSSSRSQNTGGIIQENPLYKASQEGNKMSFPKSQVSEPKGAATSVIKATRNPDGDVAVNLYKSQSGTKGSRSPAGSSQNLKNIGHDITLTPSITQAVTSTASSLSMLSRLQQQTSDLQVVAKPKQTLDLPVPIPSSITITPKQQGTSDGSSSWGQLPAGTNPKMYKDTISITEVGRKVPSGNQAAVKMTTSPTKMDAAVKTTISPTNKQEKPKEDKQGGGAAAAVAAAAVAAAAAGLGVEIITLE